MRRDSVKQTFLVAVLLCLVCSLLVSASAVGLRSFQQENKRLNKQRNILIAAGLYDPETISDSDIKNIFDEDAKTDLQVTTKILDLETSDYLTEEQAQEVLGVENISDYDQAQAANVPALSYRVAASDDIASIKRRERYSYVYEVRKNGELKQYVLPIRGYGLWSTLWGYIAIDGPSIAKGPGQITIDGLKYYQQQETPGLGGEVDNPRWLTQWDGKHVYDSNWNVKVEVTKGAVNEEYEVDAISGATITSNGVTYMMEYWFGENGFRPFLKKLAEGGSTSVSQSTARR